jgi:hypothetical protein
MKRMWILMAAVALLAGCQQKDSGGTGTSTDTGAGSGSSWSRSSSDTNNMRDTNSAAGSQNIDK